MTKSPIATTALTCFAVGSLLAILGLRLYAAFATTAIRTPWDDDHMRSAAVDIAREQTDATAASHILLPWKPPVFEGRLFGYSAWLVAALKVRHALGVHDRELAFQLINSLILLLQAVVVFLFARWATRDFAIAATFAFLHVSAPIVFGTSRWVHTENLVLLAGPTLSFLSAWLLGTAGRSGAGRLWRAGLAAYGMALCCSAREYAAPTFLVLVAATSFGLLVAKRWREAVAAVLVMTAFIIPWYPSLLEALKATFAKGGVSAYFHPFTEWIPHVAFYSVGPSLTLVLAVLLALTAYQGWRHVNRRLGAPGTSLVRVLGNQLSGLQIAAWAHWFLMGLYVAGIVWTQNRVTRPAIMPMMVGLGIVLIGFRAHPARRRWLADARIKWTAVASISISWCVLLFQLLVAFDGGKTYAHAGFRLEYFNYPLHLRKLQGPDDNWICGDVCPYDRR